MLKLTIWWVGLCFCLSAIAQIDVSGVEIPTTKQMIDKLKKPPKTRSFRNLTVESALPNMPVDATTGVAEGISPVGSAVVDKPPELSLQIEFDFDSARIRPESQQLLVLLANALQSDQLRSSRFAVEGHTDAKGNVAYNQKLSLLRAHSVQEFLGTQGIPSDRLEVVGKGSAELVNASQPYAAENRRVRIVNLD